MRWGLATWGLTYQISGQYQGSRRNTLEISHRVSPGLTTYSLGASAEMGILLPVAIVREAVSCAAAPVPTKPAATVRLAIRPSKNAGRVGRFAVFMPRTSSSEGPSRTRAGLAR